MHLPVASYGHDVAGGGFPARLTHTSGCDHVPPQLEGCGWSAPPRRCLPRVDQRKSRSLPEMREEPPRAGSVWVSPVRPAITGMAALADPPPWPLHYSPRRNIGV